MSPHRQIKVPLIMVHPICGKCKSSAVYLDKDQGDKSIVCMICGNRYPGQGKGFYMSTNDQLQEQNSSEMKKEIQKEDVPIIGDKEKKFCSRCRVKPTISDSSPYCASCMAKKGIEKRREKGEIAKHKNKPNKMKDDKDLAIKSSSGPSEAVTLDFTNYTGILKQVQTIADDEMRPLELQIIYMLKQYLNRT